MKMLIGHSEIKHAKKLRQHRLMCCLKIFNKIYFILILDLINYRMTAFNHV